MNFEKLDTYIKQELYGKNAIPGCDIIVKKGYDTVFRAQYGYADIEKKTSVSSTSQYCLYSCTKPVSATAAMRLVERGLLDLEAPAYEYLPALADVYLERDGVRYAPASPIKVKHLFTMTAGFNYNINAAPTKELLTSGKRVSAIEFATAAVKSPLMFEPGDRFLYSMCHDILGAVVEAVSGEAFGDYMKKNIFLPLGMEKTGFLNTLDERPTLPPLYVVNKETLHVDDQRNIYLHGLNENYQSGGAGLISTVEDYSKFASALACSGRAENGYEVLRPETVKLMHTEQLGSFALDSKFSCAAGAGYGYALGVRTLISKDEGQRSPIGEFGWDGAAGSYVLIDDTNNISIFFATHLCSWPALLGQLHAPLRDLTYECMGL